MVHVKAWIGVRLPRAEVNCTRWCPHRQPVVLRALVVKDRRMYQNKEFVAHPATSSESYFGWYFRQRERACFSFVGDTSCGSSVAREVLERERCEDASCEFFFVSRHDDQGVITIIMERISGLLSARIVFSLCSQKLGVRCMMRVSFAVRVEPSQRRGHLRLCCHFCCLAEELRSVAVI